MIEKIKLDSEDIEVNRMATQIERDAMRIYSITDFLLQHINNMIDAKPEIFSLEMALGDFDLALEGKNKDHDLIRIKQQLEHFILLFPDTVKFSDSLEEFIKVLETKRIESDQILHPKNYEQ